MNAAEQALLEQMRADNQQAGFPFAPRGVWEKLCHDFHEQFASQGVPQADIAWFNQSFSQSPPGNPRYHRYAVYMLYKLLKQRDGAGLLERFDWSSNTGYEIAIDGRQYSWDTLITLDTLLSIAQTDPGILSEPRVVVDLGAGWGRIGYALKRINPRACYVALDLPEILMISMAVLPRLLPEERANLYPATSQHASLSKAKLLETGLWFGGSQDLLKIDDGAIDVFINVASFQEMKLSQVRTYFELIDRKVSGVFYLQEYVIVSDAQRPYNAIGGLEQYPFKTQWKSHYVRHVTFSERFFEGCFDVNRRGAASVPPLAAPIAALPAQNVLA
jgi:putative sugar O-methyltransferase